MKRFHAHIAVDHLATSIAFYSQLFGQPPSKQEADYAKWMLEDPRINFAISSRGHATGLNHFGFQVDTAEELNALKVLAQATGNDDILDQAAATCCYANSNKHWIIDPQGIAWEHFQTMSEAKQFGSDSASQTGACCLPEANASCAPSTKTVEKTAETKGQCCA